MTIPNWLRPVLARILAVPIAALIAYLTARFALGLDDKTQAQVTTQIVEIVITIVGTFVGAYAASHKLISVKINPTDAASPVMSTTATGPLGAGQRTQLAEGMQAMATADMTADMTADIEIPGAPILYGSEHRPPPHTPSDCP